MAQYGISGALVNPTFPYAHVINEAAISNDVSPKLCYAIAYRETISGEINGLWPNAATVIAGDGGTGLFQLTPPPPSLDNPLDPYQNAMAAMQGWILPALALWVGQGYQGDTLVLLVAATFNEGSEAAEKYHAQGNVDAGTTDEYGHGVLTYYTALVNGTFTP